jgi:geranylgeranylglycerol-phosphate geranylgeranyltransferase
LAVEGVLGFLVGFLLSGAAMISNDYFDLEVHRVNHADRPLPSVRVSVRQLAALTAAFTVGGIAGAAILGAWPLLLAIPIWALGLLYNARLKETGLLGNAAVAGSVASTFVFGGLAVGVPGSGLVWTFGALAFLFDLGEEIAGDVMDVAGDTVRHARSVARVRGRRTAFGFAGGCFLAFVLVSFLPFLEGWMGTVSLLLLLIADVAIALLFSQLIRTKTPEEGRARIRQLYLVMILVVAAFVVDVVA